MIGVTADLTGVEYDLPLAQEMPDSWLGHARIRVSESDLSDEKQKAAVEKSAEYIDMWGMAASKAAVKAIEQVSTQ